MAPLLESSRLCRVDVLSEFVFQATEEHFGETNTTFKEKDNFMYLEFALTNAPPICFSANAKAASIAITSRTGRQRPAPAYCELLRAPKPVFRCCRAKARTCQSRCRPVAQAALVRAGPTYKSRPGSRARSGNCQWPGAAYHLSEIDGGPEITPHRRHRNARTSQPFCPHSVGQLECINERLGFAGLGVTRTRTRIHRTQTRIRRTWTRTQIRRTRTRIRRTRVSRSRRPCTVQ